jgi:hypothetical protein
VVIWLGDRDYVSHATAADEREGDGNGGETGQSANITSFTT